MRNSALCLTLPLLAFYLPPPFSSWLVWFVWIANMNGQGIDINPSYITNFNSSHRRHSSEPQTVFPTKFTLQWRHNGLDGVSNHQTHDCLLSRIFGLRSKKTSKLRVTGLCGAVCPMVILKKVLHVSLSQTLCTKMEYSTHIASVPKGCLFWVNCYIFRKQKVINWCVVYQKAI